MKKREIRSAIKEVYQELWVLLSLFEETECFTNQCEIPGVVTRWK